MQSVLLIMSIKIRVQGADTDRRRVGLIIKLHPTAKPAKIKELDTFCMSFVVAIAIGRENKEFVCW